MKWQYALLLILVAGCGSEPFQREPLPRLLNPDPRAIRDGFARQIPPRFTSDDTVIIQAPFHDDLAVLGVLRVDRAAGTFELVALNQIGVKLFHVAGDRTTATVRFAIPPLMAHEDLLLAVAQDIRRMYFDLISNAAAQTQISPTMVIFRESTSDGTVEKDFGGNPPVLLEKQLNGLFGPVWKVSYYEYREQSGGLYPRGIVMDNHQYHYRIIVKNRDWEADE
jgi:hypothetical protein